MAAANPPEGEEIGDAEMTALLKQADQTLYRLLMTPPRSIRGVGLLLQYLNRADGADYSILDDTKTALEPLATAAETFLGRLGTALIGASPEITPAE